MAGAITLEPRHREGAVRLQVSPVPISREYVREYTGLLETAMRSGQAVEDLLPRGMIPKGALVVSPAQVRASWEGQMPEAYSLLFKFSILTNQLGLPLEEVHIGTGKTIFYRLEKGSSVPITETDFARLRPTPWVRELRREGMDPVAAIGDYQNYTRSLVLDAEHAPLSTNLDFRMGYYMPGQTEAPRSTLDGALKGALKE